uniref:Uncharacterized protein n=1 Tax=Ciona intestinalis TaxID=7719 RepID=H2XQA0_CIOIN
MQLCIYNDKNKRLRTNPKPQERRWSHSIPRLGFILSRCKY